MLIAWNCRRRLLRRRQSSSRLCRSISSPPLRCFANYDTVAWMLGIKPVISPVDLEARRALALAPGATVRVWQKIIEGGKTRLQPFDGLVIACRHGREPGATLTV